MRWVIPSSWPVTAVDDDLTAEQILDVLDEVSTYYPGAVASLADAVTPEEAMRDGQRTA